MNAIRPTAGLEALPLFAMRARRDDQPTSVRAAASLPARTPSHQLLLDAYVQAGENGLTDEEAAARAGLDVRSCWWKRCGELRAAGLVRETGRTRRGSAGRERIVCVAVTP